MWNRRVFLCLALSVWSVANSLWAQSVASVELDGRELWKIRIGLGSFSAKERSESIHGNLVNLASDPRRSLNDIRELHSEREASLIVGRIYLFTATSDEAALENLSLEELFAARKKIAIEAITRYREARKLSRLIRTILAGVGVAAVAALLLFFLLVAYRHLEHLVRQKLAHLTAAGPIGNVYRLFEHRVVLLTGIGLKLLFVAMGAMILSFALSFVLGLSPYTEGVSHAIGGTLSGVLLQAWNAFLSYLPNLFLVMLVGIVTLFLIRTAKIVAHGIEIGAVSIPGFHRDWAEPTFDIVRILMILFALVVSFPYLPGGESPALKGASIFIGVLVSLGSGSAMGNVISGVILTYMRPFLPGDRVSIAGNEGDIIERSLLVTRIRTIKNVEVIIPNHSILGTQIINYSSHARSSGLILNTTVTIGYDAPWPKVHELLIAAALDTLYILPSPRPFVFQTSLNDFHVSYEINAFTNEANKKAEIYSELHKQIQEKFNKGGVEIMSPTYLSVRDGNTVTIPENYRPADYVPPAFRVAQRTDGSGPADVRAQSAGQE